MIKNRYDWKKVLNWVFPYKGLNDPKYIKDRHNLFHNHNGWWWGKGWWSGDFEMPTQRMKRYKKEKEKKNDERAYREAAKSSPLS